MRKHSAGGRTLGKLLVERGAITSTQLEQALAHQQKKKRIPLGQALIELGLATPDVVLTALAEQYGLPSTRINAYTMDPAAAVMLPEKVARTYLALPLFRVDNTLTVALANPRDLRALDDLRFASGCEINPVLALADEIGPAIDRCYSGGLTGIDSFEPLVVVEEGPAGDRSDVEPDQSRAVQLVDQILARAALDRASDIHLEPQERGLRVRLRIDGVLTEVGMLPTSLAPPVIARIKVLGGMDIAERRLPQDGRLHATIGPRRLDLRISTYPTVWGEKCVLRLLDRTAHQLRLEEVGMTAEILTTYRAMVSSPEGIVLVTGPTGSGKTSTLYATLNDLRHTGVNIITLENPVEYEIEGINQGQTNDKAGFTFATGFRAILRQDPDVILVGEIRDRETLDVAIEASLTGHLVLSTLHTNSAVATVTRLVEMGLDPYLLSSAVLGIVAQRLVRRVCEQCRTTVPVPPELVNVFHGDRLQRGIGCKECRSTGYRGRIGVFELLRMNEELRRLVLRRAPEDELLAANRKQGFATLLEAGISRVSEGVTTLEEVLRVTQVRA
jgi:type IV pilus assembly protein PilB